MSVQNEGATLVFQVNTCNEDSASVSVVESDTEIVVTASTRAGFAAAEATTAPIPGLFSWANLSATARSSMKMETKSVASIHSSPDRRDPVAGGPPRRDYAARCLGRDADVFPMANSELIRQAVPHSQLFRIPNVGHAVHLEAPASIHEVLSAMLDG